MINLEGLSEEELAELRVKFSEIANEAREDEKAVKQAEGHINGEKPRGGHSKGTSVHP
jgi:hypothetical protein